MNHIKKDYPFVDLLKPENEMVPPFLAVLRPDMVATMKDIGGAVKEWIGSKLRASKIGGDATRDLGADELEQLLNDTQQSLEQAEQLTADPDEYIAAARNAEGEGSRDVGTSFLSLLLGRKDMAKERAVTLDKLRRALIEMRTEDARAFDVGVEARSYRDAAQAAADRKFKVVVYGHTHLVKRVPLDGGATYLNSGTWADLMRVPTKILGEEADREEALRELSEFADDLKDRERIQRWRHQVPTFARVELGDDLMLRGQPNVHRFRPGATLEQMVVPDGQIIFD